MERYSNRDKTTSRKKGYKYNLKTNYGLSIEDYNILYNNQSGCCAICSTPLENIFLGIEGSRSSLDHCHSTGINRQLLCMSCNTGLGAFKDNPIYLDKAKEYLAKHYI